MTPPRSDAGAVRLSDAELELLLARAAEEGARRALGDVGLGGKDAVLTIHDMRSLLECISFVRRTAVQTAVHGSVSQSRAVEHARPSRAPPSQTPLRRAMRRMPRGASADPNSVSALGASLASCGSKIGGSARPSGVRSGTGCTRTTGAVRAASSAAAAVGKRASFVRFIRVGKTSLRRPASASVRASAGRIQTDSTDSPPSCSASWSGGAATRKKCVSKRLGRAAGVTQWAKRTRPSTAGTRPSAARTAAKPVAGT